MGRRIRGIEGGFHEQITFADFIVDYAYAITAIISKVVKKGTHFQRNSLVFIISFDIYY